MGNYRLLLAIAALGAFIVEMSPLPAGRHDRQPLVNSAGLTMIPLEPGVLYMGSLDSEPGRLLNEGPVRRVHISRPFYLAKTETTIAQFQQFVDDTGYRTEAERDAVGGFGINFETGAVVQRNGIHWRSPGFPGEEQSPRHPVVLTSWQDAEAFCRWLSAKEGRTYRLPTEAEWEYAARAGSSTRFWPGDDPSRLQAAANVADSALRNAMPAAEWAERWNDGHAFTAQVGSYQANAFGLHDMHGNVWEWCSDWFEDGYYAGAPLVDPQGPENGRFRSIRGGGWYNAASQNRSAQRVYFDAAFRYCLLSGFRVVLEVE